MTDRQEFREHVQKLAERGKDVEKEILAFTKKEFAEILAKAHEEGTDISLATRHMLDDVEVGLKLAGHDSKEIIVKITEDLVGIANDIAWQSLEALHSYANSSRELFDKALEKHQGEVRKVEELEEKTGTRMRETWAKLEDQTARIHQQMENVAKTVLTYSKEKAGEMEESSAVKLKQAAQTASEQAAKIAEKASAYSKKFLHHSEKKTAQWLRKLADLITTEDKK